MRRMGALAPLSAGCVGTTTVCDLERKVDRALLALIGLDLVLTLMGLLAPGLWFAVFHGVPVADPQAFLARTASAWAAFLVLQTVAWWRWRRAPVWLAVVAGVRLSDMFTDWTQAWLAADLTLFGAAAFLLASPVNLLAGRFFLSAFHAFQSPPSPRA